MLTFAKEVLTPGLLYGAFHAGVCALAVSALYSDLSKRFSRAIASLYLLVLGLVAGYIVYDGNQRSEIEVVQHTELMPLTSYEP